MFVSNVHVANDLTCARNHESELHCVVKDRLATQAPGPVFVLVNACMLSVANRQHYVKGCCLKKLACKLLAVFKFDRKRCAVSNYLLKKSGALYTSPSSHAKSI